MLCDFNSKSRLLCLLSEAEDVKVLETYNFQENFDSYKTGAVINLTPEYCIHDVQSLSLQGTSFSVWLLANQGRQIMQVNLKTGNKMDMDFRSKSSGLARSFQKINISPSGNSALIHAGNGIIIPAFVGDLTMLNPVRFFANNCEIFSLDIRTESCQYAATICRNEIYVKKNDL